MTRRDYIGADGSGRLIPPPKVCPRCGGPTRRTGNRHERHVHCASGVIDPGNFEDRLPSKACLWSASVYHVPKWQEHLEYVEGDVRCVGWGAEECSSVVPATKTPRCEECEAKRVAYVEQVIAKEMGASRG